MSNFDDDVSRKIDELRSERLSAQKQAELKQAHVRERYARLGRELAQALDTGPFDVLLAEASADAADDWEYEVALPDEGFCVVIQWRDSDEEVGLVTMDVDNGFPLFEPNPNHEVSSFFEIVSGHDASDFARRVREVLVEGLAKFAISKDA